MKNIIFKTLCFALLTVGALSCATEPELPLPVSLSENGGVTATSGAGSVTLNWSAITDQNLYYVEVRYTIEGEQFVKTASQYTTGITIDRLLKRYGEITFEVQPFNRSQVGGETLTVKAEALPADLVVTPTGKGGKLELTTERVTVDNAHPTDGTVADMFDTDAETSKLPVTSTAYKSDYDNATAMPHFVVVDLGEDIYSVSFRYYTCEGDDANFNPSQMKIYASKTFDGVNFNTASCVLLEDIDSGLPNTAATRYNSSNYKLTTPFRYLWIEVDATYGGSSYFGISDLYVKELYASIYDPETDTTIPAKKPTGGGELVKDKIELSAANLHTNAQEASEGPIADLIDGNNSTFFHSSWSEDIDSPHCFVIGLDTPIDMFSFAYCNRVRASLQNDNNIKNMKVYVGTDWSGAYSTAGMTLAADLTELPNEVGVTDAMNYTSDVFEPGVSFNFIYFEVASNWDGGAFFAMGEMEIYECYYGD